MHLDFPCGFVPCLLLHFFCTSRNHVDANQPAAITLSVPCSVFFLILEICWSMHSNKSNERFQLAVPGRQSFYALFPMQICANCDSPFLCNRLGVSDKHSLSRCGFCERWTMQLIGVFYFSCPLVLLQRIVATLSMLVQLMPLIRAPKFNSTKRHSQSRRLLYSRYQVFMAWYIPKWTYTTLHRQSFAPNVISLSPFKNSCT